MFWGISHIPPCYQCLLRLFVLKITFIILKLSEPPLHFRQLQLSSNFYIKNVDHPENPISTLFLNTDIKSIFIKSQKQNLLLPLYLSKNNIPTKFHPLLPIVTHTPPWLLELPHTVFDLLETKKAPSNNFEIQNQLSEILNSRFKDATRCYTDGSKTNQGVGCSFSIQDSVSYFRLKNLLSAYSAELTAILLCLEEISQLQTNTEYLILTD